jgi:predicted DNA-binding protein YlxM (UPF0122 family)
MSPNDSLPIKEFAELFGYSSEAVLQAIEAQRYRLEKRQAYYSISQLASRWDCSKPAVYAALKSEQAKIINMGSGEKRRRILVPASVVEKIEKARTEKMS